MNIKPFAYLLDYQLKRQSDLQQYSLIKTQILILLKVLACLKAKEITQVLWYVLN